MHPDFSSMVQVNLRWGRDHARTIGELAEAMNVSRRSVEKAVENLRIAGVPVCTGPDGVWLTTSGDELLAQYRALRARYIHQAQNARVLLRTARRYAKQRQLAIWEAA